MAAHEDALAAFRESEAILDALAAEGTVAVAAQHAWYSRQNIAEELLALAQHEELLALAARLVDDARTHLATGDPAAWLPNLAKAQRLRIRAAAHVDPAQLQALLDDASAALDAPGDAAVPLREGLERLRAELDSPQGS